MQILLKNQNVNRFVLFLVFLVLVTLLLFVKNQFVVGSIINAALFLSTAMIGLRYAILLCFIPSLIASFIGILSLSLLPLIAFIMLANIILVLTFNFLKENSYIKAMVIASLLKCLFLILVVIVALEMCDFSSMLLAVLTWPQVITALLGSLIASSILKIKGYRIR